MTVQDFVIITAVFGILGIFLWWPKKSWPYFLEAGVAIGIAIYAQSLIWSATAIVFLLKGIYVALGKEEAPGTWLFSLFQK